MNQKKDKLARSCTLSVLITSVCALLLCTVCLVSTTWAWINVDSQYEGTKIVLSDKCEVTEPQETVAEEVPEEVPEETTIPEETQSQQL